MEWVSNCIDYWLAIPFVTTPSLCFHFRRQNKFWVESFVGELVSLLLHWGYCLETGGGLLKFVISNVVIHS